MRNVLNHVWKTNGGVIEIRKFVRDGTYEKLHNWVQASQNNNGPLAMIESIEDLLYNNKRDLEQAMSNDFENINTKDKIRKTLRLVKTHLNNIAPDIFPKSK